MSINQNRPLAERVVRFPIQRVLRWAAAIILVAVFISAGAVPASANSVPGEVLYPVKRGAERVELVLTASDFARVRTHLIQAARIVPADITDEDLGSNGRQSRPGRPTTAGTG